jgi:hypothetical protein
MMPSSERWRGEEDGEGVLARRRERGVGTDDAGDNWMGAGAPDLVETWETRCEAIVRNRRLIGRQNRDNASAIWRMEAVTGYSSGILDVQ